MKKVQFIIMCTVLSFLLVFTVSAGGEKEGTAGGVEKMNIIIQHNSSENHPWQQGFEYVKAELEKEFPEAFDIVIHPNGALANRDWKVELEQTQTNVIQMMCESSIPFATLQSELFALNTPFLFDDMEHYLRYMNTRPEVVYKWFDLLEEKNVQVIAVWPRPPRQLLNSAREIRTPDDIKGLKFRVPGLDLFIQTFEAMGAKPVPMSASEIYTAMQLGTVVGEDNAIGTVFDFKTYEQGKYFNLWNYMADGVLVVVNKPWFDSLDENHRKFLVESTQRAAKIVYDGETVLQEKAKKEMSDFGIVFTKYTPEMKKPFIKLMAPVYSSIEEIVGSEDWKLYFNGVKAAQ